jgi:predicted Zn-dependent protease
MHNKFNTRKTMEKEEIKFRFLLLMVILLIIPSCAINPVTGKRQLMLMSENQEVAMGTEYDKSVIAAFGEYKDEDLNAFLNRIGDEMGLISHRPKLKYHFKILDSPVINAFAVPGGYIYLTRGILAHFNNEAELVGVMGHEMGHITARHTASQQSRQQLSQLILIGGMIASEDFRELAGYAMQGMHLLFLSFSRDNERESDRLGVEYSSKLGYDANKMADFFKVLNKMNMESENAGVPTFMSTHPDPGDRYNSVLSHSAEWQQKLDVTDWKVNTNNYLAMIDGMVYGEDPRQGYVDGNVFYHPEMKFRFSYPARWKLVNSPFQVSIAPEEGKALIIFTLAQGNSLEEAVQNTMKQMNLTVAATRPVTVNGMPAIAVSSKHTAQDQNTGETQNLELLSYFINDNGKYFVFHGISAESDFNTHAGYFENTMKTFSRLSDPARLNVKPKRVLVRKVSRSGSLADAFKDLGVPQPLMNELALLNNLELTGRVEAGRLIKIIGE